MAPSDSEQEQYRDVFAHFGRAMYHAEMLERRLVASLAAARASGGPTVDVAAWDELWQPESLAPVVEVVRWLERFAEAPRGLDAAVRPAMLARNLLAHGYFAGRMERHATVSGRRDMIAELDHIAESLRSMDVGLAWLTNRVESRLTVSDEEIEAALSDVVPPAPEPGEGTISDSGSGPDT